MIIEGLQRLLHRIYKSICHTLFTV